MNGNPYHLYASQRSPFARRIRLALNRLQIEATEEFVDVFANPASLNAVNPMGAVPTLMTRDFGPICDSTNILEYLHEKTGAIWPKEEALRIRVRQSAVLANAIIQASVLFYQEVFMHEIPSEFWKRDHTNVIHATLSTITQTSKNSWMNDQALTQAGWDLAVALEYVSVRLSFIEWEKNYPDLKDIVDLARTNSFFKDSTPKL